MNTMKASRSDTKLSIRNGTDFPNSEKSTEPNGGAIKQPNEMKANAIPSAADRSPSSVKRSAIIARPDVSANAEPKPLKMEK